MTEYYKVLGERFKTRNGFDWMPFLKGEWVEEKDCETSSEACGKGLHVWKDFPRYTIHRYIEDHTFLVETEGLLGQDEEKARFRKLRIARLVLKEEIFKPKAYLSRADLSGAYLSRADLSGADLSGADLSGAYLSRADLSRADLSGADLSGAYLSRAYLSGANLSRANLSGGHNTKSIKELSDEQRASAHC